MKTLLKFPVYIEIDTDNIDRKIVTNAAKEILFPEVSDALSNESFTRATTRRFSKQIGCSAKLQFLTEPKLINDRLSPQ